VEFVRYKHARFSAQFPKEFRYSRSHYWMSLQDATAGRWHVGFTKFATRMLGELVEARFRVAPGDPVAPGDEIGWVEGFKAASDVFCVMEGVFEGMNPALAADACVIRSSPYADGYLYAVRGAPEPDSLDVHGYVAHLEELINRMQTDPQYAGAAHDPEA
jgi:glycine cleavage system H protein